MQDGKIKGLAHIGLCVSDLDRSKKFYSDILGFAIFHECEVTDNSCVIRVAFARLNDCTLELVEIPDTTANIDGTINHIALMVDNIEVVRDHLAAKNIKFETDEIVHCMEVFPPLGTKWILFRGPDNERLEINEVQKG